MNNLNCYIFKFTNIFFSSVQSVVNQIQSVVLFRWYCCCLEVWFGCFFTFYIHLPIRLVLPSTFVKLWSLSIRVVLNTPHRVCEGFPGGSVVKNLSANAADISFNPWVGKIPWRRKWQPTPVFLLGKSHEQRSLAGYNPWGCKRVGHNLVTKTTQHLWVRKLGMA